MAEDQIRYDLLTQDALRGVVRDVLTRVAETGLPGEHHLYIAFDTQADGVSVSDRLREQYPDEMTIVLQYQFWDLEIEEDRFEVKLSFNNVPERLVVPFAAIKAFYDPSVQFGLQFGTPDAASNMDRGEAGLSGLADSTQDGASLPAVAESTGREGAPRTQPARREESGDDSADAPAAEVVELDAFRNRK